jgi:hypothetical protein
MTPLSVDHIAQGAATNGNQDSQGRKGKTGYSSSAGCMSGKRGRLLQNRPMRGFAVANHTKKALPLSLESGKHPREASLPLRV